ncbi:MAG: hypothetical protein HY785_00905 [Oscillatoriophycideae cyanobacterium NC_groundwater_1537_Pr4_S-0.65um_50_18]|nr:hypothetical protein [Oscillatoriophycideae cyanobacterium NC_groundwater_1537_Pr4_S-0.65um_50_18]
MPPQSSSPQPSPEHPSTSVWHYKPWWCQPWSIALTGIVLIGGSWLPFHQIWVTAIVALPVLTWMGFFLILYPQAMQQAVSQAEQTESTVNLND